MSEEKGHGVEGVPDCVNAVWDGQVKVLHIVLNGLCHKELTAEGRRFVWGLIEKIEHDQNRRTKLMGKPRDCGCKK